MGTTFTEAVLKRLAEGDALSTREMMDYRRQPGATADLILALRQAPDPVRRQGVKLLVDLGRVLVPPAGAIPERPGPIVDSRAVVACLVELLDDPDGEVRRTACVALAALVPGALVEAHAGRILASIERNPSIDGSVVLVGKTRSPAALALLSTNPVLASTSPEDAQMARARLGDESAERALIAAYEATAEARARANQARRLGYVGSGRAAGILARDIRTPATYVWSGMARRSLRVHLIEGLHLAYMTEPIFWPPFSRPTGDAYYEGIERWLTAHLGTTWEAPRPPFLYQEDAPTPPRPRPG